MKAIFQVFVFWPEVKREQSLDANAGCVYWIPVKDLNEHSHL